MTHLSLTWMPTTRRAGLVGLASRIRRKLTGWLTDAIDWFECFGRAFVSGAVLPHFVGMVFFLVGAFSVIGLAMGVAS